MSLEKVKIVNMDNNKISNFSLIPKLFPNVEKIRLNSNKIKEIC